MIWQSNGRNFKENLLDFLFLFFFLRFLTIFRIDYEYFRVFTSFAHNERINFVGKCDKTVIEI